MIIQPHRELVLVLCLVAAVTASAQTGDPPFRWFKGNLHTHSLWSDGNDFPEMIADRYREKGYHFLALSDHNILSRGEKWVTRQLIRKRQGRDAVEKYLARFGASWVETRGDPEDEAKHEFRLKPLSEFRHLVEERDRFLMIQAEEITDKFEKHSVHLNATNLGAKIDPQGGKSVREVIERNLAVVEAQAQALGRPILLHLNHPNWGWSITAEDLAAVVKERFFEVFNGHPGTMHLGDDQHPGTEYIWDVANTLRIARHGAPPLYGIATDDSHHYHAKDERSYSRSFRGWVRVRARRLTPASVIHAMQAGDFHSSTGVSLESVTFDGKTLEVRVAPREGATYVTRFVGTLKNTDLTATPRRDDKGRPVTAVYAGTIGETLAEVKGPVARYTLKGDELYVRAVVTSSLPVEDPIWEGQTRQAWSQPVGWRKPPTKQ